MVISRPTSDCQSLAALTTMVAAPVVSAARKVMMATTAASERPAIELSRHDRRRSAAARDAGQQSPRSDEAIVPRLRHGLDRLSRRHVQS
jgi:hypothetical protein